MRIFNISFVALAIIFGLAESGLAQFQVQPQVNNQVGPIYPSSPSPYNFHSSQSSDPFRFNWYTGRWDYDPIPTNPQNYGSGGSPYNYNPATGHWDFVGAGAVPANPSTPNIPAAPTVQGQSSTILPIAPPTPTTPPAQQPETDPMPGGNDGELWNPPATRPTTRPESAEPPKSVAFTGKIVGMRAVVLAEEPIPHLLIRLRSDAGAFATVDVGDRLNFADFPADSSIAAHGYLGGIDGKPVLFADQIYCGSHNMRIDREGTP